MNFAKTNTMTTKEKYELIDKSQVSEKLLTILQNMEKSSKNFTDEAVNSRVDSALDKIIEGFKAKKPEALRTITEAKKEVKKARYLSYKAGYLPIEGKEHKVYQRLRAEAARLCLIEAKNLAKYS